MFYSNNNSYMEDFYYYNQMPGNTYMNSGNNILGTPVNYNFGNWENMNYSNMGGFNSNNMHGRMQTLNLNNLYPSIYRIISPVVSRVVSNSNNQFINEEILNNMTDTVFNIVEGQIDISEESQTSRNTTNENPINSNSSNITSSNTNSIHNTSNRNVENSRNVTTSSISNNSINNRNDSLLRDFIKILILKELFSRNYIARQMNFPSNNIYNPYF